VSNQAKIANLEMPEDFFENVRVVIERRLRIGNGACLMKVKSVLRKAFDFNRHNQPDLFQDMYVVGYVHIERMMIDEYGATLFRDDRLRGKRVYKFESD